MFKNITFRRGGSGLYPVGRRGLFGFLPGMFISAHSAGANEIRNAAEIRVRFDQWLQETGLSSIFRVESLSEVNASENDQTLAAFAEQRGLINGQIVYFRFLLYMSSADLNQPEVRKAEERLKYTMLDAIFMHFAEFANCSPQEVCLRLSSPTFDGFVYRLAGGQLGYNGYHGSSSQYGRRPQAVRGESQVRISLPEAASLKIFARENIVEETFKTLKRYYERQGGDVRLLEKRSDRLEIQVWSLRGEFDSPSAWQKLHLFISFYYKDTDKADVKLVEINVIVSGSSASGIGKPPPNTAYKPVDPRFYEGLSDYARELAAAISEKLKNPDKDFQLRQRS